MLAAHDLFFAWPDRAPLLEGVSLTVAPGELVALVGANGSGKSTLLRILAGLLAPASGRVEIAGRPLATLDGTGRARALSFLPQLVQPLYPTTARRMVELARHPWSGTDPDRDARIVEGALEDCDVLDLAARSFDELSGGERQRVLLAGALAQSGKVLLLDEPTAALDLPHAVGIFSRLQDQLTTDRCALVVTHDLNLAAAWADRILLLHGGRILAEGSAREVLAQDKLDRALGVGTEVILHPRNGQPRVLPRSRRAAP